MSIFEAPEPQVLSEYSGEICQVFPEIRIYRDFNFGGPEWVQNFSSSEIHSVWQGRISSIIVVSGEWIVRAGRSRSWKLEIGYYPDVRQLGIPDNSIDGIFVA